jgi:hypothetical protein
MTSLSAVGGAGQRKIVWADGKRLSIEQSVARIHAGHPGVARDLIEPHVLGWLESCVPESCFEPQLEELDRLIEPWLDGLGTLVPNVVSPPPIGAMSAGREMPEASPTSAVGVGANTFWGDLEV